MSWFVILLLLLCLLALDVIVKLSRGLGLPPGSQQTKTKDDEYALFSEPRERVTPVEEDSTQRVVDRSGS